MTIHDPRTRLLRVYKQTRPTSILLVSLSLCRWFSSPTFALQCIHTHTHTLALANIYYKRTYDDEWSPKGRKWGLIDGHITWYNGVLYLYIYKYIYTLYEFGTSHHSLVRCTQCSRTHTHTHTPPTRRPRSSSPCSHAKGVTPTYGQLLKQ